MAVVFSGSKQKGDKGDTGEQGITGVPGAQGSAGTTLHSELTDVTEDQHHPKTHNQALGTITGHDKTTHDALSIDAATLGGKTLEEVTDPAADIRVKNTEGIRKDVGYASGDEAVPIKLQDIDTLLRTLLNTPLARLAIDSAGRLRIIIDVAGVATPITISSGTVTTLSTLSTITTFPYGQSWELMQRANMEYDQIQRSKMVIT